jgi:hypothetical protein
MIFFILLDARQIEDMRGCTPAYLHLSETSKKRQRKLTFLT